MFSLQKTLNKRIKFFGKGLHTGMKTNIVLNPANENTGIIFKRTDLNKNINIKADVDNVVETNRGTTLGKDGYKIHTIEHLLSALSGLGIDNAIIEIDNVEPPIFDGSSKPFVDKILNAGIKNLNDVRNQIVISNVINYKDDRCMMKILPSDEFKITYYADFSYGNIGKDEFTYSYNESYNKEISLARTFCSIGELVFLKENGLIQGADLNSGIVFLDDNVNKEKCKFFLAQLNIEITSLENKNYTLNNVKLRYNNEPIRHKILDLIGDFTLLGSSLKGHILSYGGGHFSNVAMMKKIKSVYGKV